jgi:hypothetical protein
MGAEDGRGGGGGVKRSYGAQLLSNAQVGPAFIHDTS